MSKFRIPATTALFITGLAHIIRDELKIDVVEHECWTFEQAANWAECGSPNYCPVHGKNPSEYPFPCYEDETRIYLGVGHLLERGHRGRKTELRVRIEHIHNDAMGELYIVWLWVKGLNGQITSGSYGLQENGDAYLHEPHPREKRIPEYPPKKIAFWKDKDALVHEEAAV